MTRFHTIALDRARVQRWANGGGITRELAAWPHPDDWKLRVSVARVDHSGPFSPYPAVERWFAVIDGPGVQLMLPEGPKNVFKGDAPLRFEGEAAPHCHLLEGPTLDLNLMVRRGAGVARMERAHAGSVLEGTTIWRGVFAAGPVLLDIDGITEPLHAGTLAWTDDQAAQRWELHDRSLGPAWWLVLQA